MVAALKRDFPENSGIATIPIAAIDIAIVSPQNANDMSSSLPENRDEYCCYVGQKAGSAALLSRITPYLHEIEAEMVPLFHKKLKKIQ
jgi:hypothetical protein